MAKHKGDIGIGKRAAEEVYRVFKNYAKAARILGCHKRIFYDWNEGDTPGGHYLAALHYHGCDVMYILTGVRQKT